MTIDQEGQMVMRAVFYAGLLAAWAPDAAFAAGYAIKEQSTTAQGASFAGATAGGDNISYMFFNPAAITLHEGTQFHVSTAYIAPFSNPDVKSATAANTAAIAGGDGGSNISVHALVPAIYGSTEVIDNVFLGLGVNSPFGLATDYDGNWAGRHHGVDSKLLTINMNPVIAWKAPKWFSFALGAQIQYADARLTSAIDLPLPNGVTDGASVLKGDDWGFGFTAGVLFQPWEGTRIGLAYRSQVDHTLKGDVDFSGLGFPFVDQGISAEITTPDSFSVGLYQRLDEDWAVLGEIAWTNWSHFDELRVEFANGVLPDSVTVEDWGDSWFVALGTEYRASESLTLRGGLAFDESPIPSETRTPRLPGADRYWASLGASYRVADWLTIDGAVTGIYLDDPDIKLNFSDPNNLSRGALNVDYDSWIAIFSLGGTVRF